MGFTDDSYSSDFAEKSELKPLYSDYARNLDGLDLFGLGISQISGDFADNLQNFCFFLGGFNKKAYFCGKV